MFKIVVATDLERLPSVIRQRALEQLEELSFQGKAVILRIPRSMENIDADIFEGCDAIVVRPSDKKKILPEYLDKANSEQVRIFSVGVGKDHLDGLAELPSERTKVLDTQPLSNAIGVAAFNFLLANALFANFSINISTVDDGGFQSMAPEQTSLVGKTWLVIGSGKQVSPLLEFGYSSGVKKFYIYNNPMDKDRFSNCMDGVSSLAGKVLKKDDRTLTAKMIVGKDQGDKDEEEKDKDKDQNSKQQFEVVCIGELTDDICSVVDVISLHVTLTSEEQKGRPPTVGMMNKELLKRFTKRPILINTGRGELINEADVLELLKQGWLRGVAVDVLDKDVEAKHNHKNSLLWSARLSNEKSRTDDPLNLIITPHIAGSCDHDIGPMWNEILRKIASAVAEHHSD